MVNNVDRQDDETWKIRAATGDAARIIAQSSAIDDRFVARRGIPARGGKKWEREVAAELRQMVTRVFQ
jgi:hypothetical protein